MANEKKFCANCGSIISNGNVCSKCGYNQDDGTPEPQEPNNANTTQNSTGQAGTTYAYENTNVNTWNTIENAVVFAGKFSWILVIINVIAYIITAIANFVAIAAAVAADIPLPIPVITPVWYLIGAVASVAFSIIFVLPFSKRVANREWHFLVNDVIIIGNIRVPKMIIIGIIVEIFGQGWGGLFVLLPAILICFLGPAYMQWRK